MEDWLKCQISPPSWISSKPNQILPKIMLYALRVIEFLAGHKLLYFKLVMQSSTSLKQNMVTCIYSWKLEIMLIRDIVLKIDTNTIQVTGIARQCWTNCIRDESDNVAPCFHKFCLVFPYDYGTRDNKLYK